jgi:hypothetical protein
VTSSRTVCLRPLRQVADVVDVELDAARGRVLEPDDQAHQSRLAAAVRSCDGDELASLHVEIDVPQHGRRVAVGERHALQTKG